MTTTPTLPIIQVCGDPTVDWLAVRSTEGFERENTSFWAEGHAMPAVLGSQAGGSALLLELIRAMAGKYADVQGPELDRSLLSEPMSGGITNLWTSWQGYADRGRSKPAFRLCEWQGCELGRWAYEENRLSGRADLLVLADSALAFRDLPEGWPEALGEGSEPPQHILLKLAGFGGGRENRLLKRILELGLGSRTTIVAALSDLRTCAVKIGASLSWESLFEDIVTAVYSPECPFADAASGRLEYGRVIVTIGTAGAVVAEDGRDTLIFDRTGQEGDFSSRHEGRMLGLNTCVVSALAARWAEERNDIDWAEAARDGVGLARYLDAEGCEVAAEELRGTRRNRLRFPSGAIAAEYRLRREGKSDGRSRIWGLGIFRSGGIRALAGTGWSILEESVKAKKGPCAGASDAMNAVTVRARSIVIQGPAAALPDIPLEAVNNWRSADRQEIEGVRSVSNAIRSYLKGRDGGAPLCIAVFGPPGAGKSFAIKEIARELGIEKDAQLTFNLSQLVSTEELASALHQIRDLNLKGRKPLVFFDEFDTPFDGKRLGWLKYFLAPMQDGEFTDHGRVHPIGGGIFVFAGATRHSFGDFCRGGSEDEISAKKPDFISRLKAYIDVKGPNGSPNTIEDRLYVIRRAFLLNSFLERYAGNLKGEGGFRMEPKALDAFLRVNRYRHGARSMETLVKMSGLAGKSKYELSSLPPTQILDMHVSSRDFLSLAKYGHLDMMRVGITGHIALDPDHLGKLEACVDAAIAFVEAHYPGRSLTVFSPMALGADRLVARRLLQREGAGLIAVLPVPKDDYVNDFGGTDDHNLKVVPEGKSRQEPCENAYADAEMRQEFNYWLDNRAIEVIELPPAPTRDDAYLQAGYFIAENSDLMFAVWDGQPAQGVGGTGDIVRRAVACGKPVVHVWAGNYKPDPSKRTAVGDRLGTFRYVNISGAEDRW